ncbi:helix-turn-helix domain-containing protein [Enterococcus raffinosus]|uniref:Helix-turn-helix transcriptional regulator n=1 Tax=Enterococcus raffinosus TaxID=71452 RepID=A0AAW8T553_9ENTE|nr:helix-turn-helix transcriptional regulator [Enterococcus raffinosus]MDT2522009.1 helix-turn-helix transcriptional regulator [Enterococcus raffinosus]MDT2528353.1 helix-turn-helix transcriptional regulator [Enterococcus raffinosus]MDT2533181.1 helix-turn-helix transcriptional regulator [Enterococcus raffinosus]MDT2543621.1 helix-turn-helix transcriptional regulator [Enterococcus raffinosus]MDT2553735.1 helix-turn-helix transcriptional regulator [Enterococcus raffinosus]
MTMFDKIKALSKKRGKSLKQVAIELGLGENYFYTLKKQSPKGDTLNEIADYFHVSTDYLLGRTNNPNINDDELPKEFDIRDDTITMTYGGIALSESEKHVILAAARALVEQRDKNNEE